MKSKFFSTNVLMVFAVLLALISGYLHLPFIYATAEAISNIFVNLLKMVSIPIIFLSIVSTVSGMDNMLEFKGLGKRVIKYTLLTTMLSATIALLLFISLDPVRTEMSSHSGAVLDTAQKGYLHYLIQAIPSNVVEPFSESHVISVLFLAILLSLAILSLPDQNRKPLHQFFSSLYAAVMKVTFWIVMLIPIGIWAFITLFLKDMRNGLEIESLAIYLACVVGSNLIQGLIVLPLFLKSKGISPIKLAKGMFPALSLAFFSKSSNATLPLAMRCAEERMGISRKTTSFTLPLCTTINMNACAAFILTTVLFVSMSNGMVFSGAEMIMWIFVATIAAVGNAGVPMGCYFLSSAFLAAMNVPLNILGIILPFYAMIDMLETAINVWSDSCVLAVVDKEVQQEAGALVTNPV
jgi:Na+/H+-dicarboxylate symporter